MDGLLTSELRWLWEQLADAADRRGDPDLTSRTVNVVAPADPSHRAAALGLLGSRVLSLGQRRRVDLADLARRLTPLTPGAVAAHAVRRRLARSAAEKAERHAAEVAIRARLGLRLPEAATDDAWSALRRTGWVGRLISSDDRLPDLRLVDLATAVVLALPGAGDPPVDRRLLAHDAADGPHHLDPGQPLAALALTLLAVTGRIEAGLAPRDAWTAVGVRYDDIAGGLTTVGILPTGWTVPAATPVTLPPRVLSDVDWPPGGGRTVFVTENPSVLSAAIGVVDARVVCTLGTPSLTEVDAIARLEDRGWRLLVRADFDDAGLTHVARLIAAAPHAEPWRMAEADYLAGLHRSESTAALRVNRIPATPWDPPLATTMRTHGFAVFEETFLDQLVDDIATAPEGGTHGSV